MCIAYNFMFTYIDLLLAMFVPGSALDLHRSSLRQLTISLVGFLCFATCLCGKLAMLVPGLALDLHRFTLNGAYVFAYNSIFRYIDLLSAMFVPASALDLHPSRLRRCI